MPVLIILQIFVLVLIILLVICIGDMNWIINFYYYLN
jgi:hypothetical protein